MLTNMIIACWKKLAKKIYKCIRNRAGFHSHIQYIKHDFDNYYILEKEKDKLSFIKRCEQKN